MSETVNINRFENYRPRNPEVNCRDLFVGTPSVLNIERDGFLIERLAMEFEDPDPRDGNQTVLPEVIFQESSEGEATIDFRADGSVVGFAGRPGKELSPPRIIRPSTFSFLEMHWPLIASAATTVLVLVMAFRRLSPRQVRTLGLILVLVGINTASALVSLTTREPPRLLSKMWANGYIEEYYSDGSRHIYATGSGGVPRRATRIERPSPPPTSLQIWWPVLASGSITILILGLWWRLTPQRGIESVANNE